MNGEAAMPAQRSDAATVPAACGELRCTGQGSTRTADDHRSECVPRLVRDFIEISECTSLDTLIRFLETIRANLPAGSEPQMVMKGDDRIGRRLTISFLRELSAEEAHHRTRHTGAVVDAPDAAIDLLRAKLDKVPFDDGVQHAP
jgi:hypothetical protein